MNKAGKETDINRFIYLIVILIFTSGCLSSKRSVKPDKENEQRDYYALKDFNSVAKIDSHVHFNTVDTAFTKQSEEDKFWLLDIVNDRPFGPTMESLQEIALNQVKAWPDRIAFAATIPVNDWHNDTWEQETLVYLKNIISKGAVAVKVWKNIGMDLKDMNGKYVMIDNPRFDSLFDYLAKTNITIIGHNGEPKDCWLPLEKMTVKGNRNYYSQHPEYHMYLHPECPSYEDQIQARDNMLEKHPDLKFIGAHLGSMEWSLDELGMRLDRFPNMAVDLSRMANLQIHALNNWQKTRDFFIKYQDRLIYGTDRTVSPSANQDEIKKSIHEARLQHWKFFATGDLINEHEGEGELHGLKLPKEVIDKIYRTNAEKWLPGMIKMTRIN
jgi:hypothetical protein